MLKQTFIKCLEPLNPRGLQCSRGQFGTPPSPSLPVSTQAHVARSESLESSQVVWGHVCGPTRPSGSQEDGTSHSSVPSTDCDHFPPVLIGVMRRFGDPHLAIPADVVSSRRYLQRFYFSPLDKRPRRMFSIFVTADKALWTFLSILSGPVCSHFSIIYTWVWNCYALGMHIFGR